jgi:hypothetical protein
LRTSNTRTLFQGSRPDGGVASVGARLVGGVEKNGIGQHPGQRRTPTVPFPLDTDRMANTWAPEIAAAHNALIWTPECGFPRIRGLNDAMGRPVEDDDVAFNEGKGVSQEAQDMAYRMASARWLRGEARAHESALAVNQHRAGHTREVVALGVDIFGLSDKVAEAAQLHGIHEGMGPAERLERFDAIRYRRETRAWVEIRGGRMGSKENHPSVSQERLGNIIKGLGLGYYDVDPVSGLFWFELENSAPEGSNEFLVAGDELQRVLKHVAYGAGERCRIMTMWHSHYRSARISAADMDHYPSWLVERGLIFHQPSETTLHYNASGSVFWEGKADA